MLKLMKAGGEEDYGNYSICCDLDAQVCCLHSLTNLALIFEVRYYTTFQVSGGGGGGGRG